MTENKLKRVFRRLTDEERAEHARVRELVAAERPEIDARAKAAAAQHRRKPRSDERVAIAQTWFLLKRERERQGITLGDVSKRTGISVPDLSALENGKNENPTVKTLNRVAEALGLKLLVVLGELERNHAVVS